MTSEPIPARWKLRYNTELGSLVAGISTGAFIGAFVDPEGSMTLRPVPFAVMAICYLVLGLVLRTGKPGVSRKSIARFFLSVSGAVAVCALIAGTGGINGIEVTPVPAGILAGVLTTAVIICEIITRLRRRRQRAEKLQRIQMYVSRIEAAADARAEGRRPGLTHGSDA